MTGEERSSERMMEEEEGEGVNDSEAMRERGRGEYWRRGSGEKLIQWDYERLMRIRNEKIRDRSDSLCFAH